MSGQVSIWVPILVALLGIAGVLGGQLLNAWRDDKRWERERSREEARANREWQRERARWERERDRERETYWRNERLIAYSRFIEVMYDWHGEMWNVLQDRYGDKDISSDALERLRTYDQAGDSALARITIVGPKRVDELCEQAFAEYRGISWMLREGETPKQIAGAEPMDYIVEEFRTVVDSIRAELGFDVAAEKMAAEREGF